VEEIGLLLLILKQGNGNLSHEFVLLHEVPKPR
jgi:hypothetical protein